MALARSRRSAHGWARDMRRAPERRALVAAAAFGARLVTERRGFALAIDVQLLSHAAATVEPATHAPVACSSVFVFTSTAGVFGPLVCHVGRLYTNTSASLSLGNCSAAQPQAWRENGADGVAWPGFPSAVHRIPADKVLGRSSQASTSMRHGSERVHAMAVGGREVRRSATLDRQTGHARSVGIL